jgi:pectate lyase
MIRSMAAIEPFLIMVKTIHRAFAAGFVFQICFVFMVLGAACGRNKNVQESNGNARSRSESVFPGAQGFGVETAAGRGGRVIKVVNLEADGPGSFREALSSKGPRIVVFEVGGVIDIDRVPLEITEPCITVAGQTAPSPGITVIREGMRIAAHDVLIQHIRFRMGDAGAPKKSGFEPECTVSGPEAHHVVVDHCSFAWAVDENMSVSGPRYNGPSGTSHDITISNCIIAEGLADASHTKGVHSMGTLVHDYCANVAVLRNLYAHNNERNPYFKAFTTGVVVNNAIYNPGQYAVQIGFPDGEWTGRAAVPKNGRISVVGNVMRHGANTVPSLGLVGRRGDVYLEDNAAFDAAGKPVAMTFGDVRLLKDKPSWPPFLEVLPCGGVESHVASHAGARPLDRDAVDKRIVSDFLNHRGKMIDSQTEAGGYPSAGMTVRKLDVPAEDVQAWLQSFSTAVGL